MSEMWTPAMKSHSHRASCLGNLVGLIAIACIVGVCVSICRDFGASGMKAQPRERPKKRLAKPLLTAEQKAQKAQTEKQKREKTIARVIARLAIKETFRDPKFIHVQATFVDDEYYWVNVEFEGINVLKMRLLSEVKTVFVWKEGAEDGWMWSFDPKPPK